MPIPANREERRGYIATAPVEPKIHTHQTKKTAKPKPKERRGETPRKTPYGGIPASSPTTRLILIRAAYGFVVRSTTI